MACGPAAHDGWPAAHDGYSVEMVDWLTVLVSAGMSLAVSYLGVRYFTGPRLRAEHASTARRQIRNLVSPIRRDIRLFAAGMKSGLERDGTAFAQDGIDAQQIMLIAHDLPRLTRRQVERRLDVIYGTGWMRLVRLRDSTVEADHQVSASFMTELLLFDRSEEGQPARSYVDGLLQRGLEEGRYSEAIVRLERQLLLLEQCR